MIPYHLNQTIDKLKGPTEEQLVTGNQWAISALDRYHPNAVANFEFNIDGIGYSSKLTWDKGFSRAAMREKKDMANHGAVALAMFVMSVLLDYPYVEQTEIGDGVDYKFMKNIPDDNDLNFLSDGHYVEVSGILEEVDSNTLDKRIKDKHRQISRGTKNTAQSSVIVTLFKHPKTIKEVHS